MKLLPIGTVIRLNNHKVCIIGYGSANKKEKSVCGYFVVLYPVGFTNIEKVLFVPHYAKFEIIAAGYNTAPSEKILDTLANSLKILEKVPNQEILKIHTAFEKISVRKKETDEV